MTSNLSPRRRRLAPALLATACACLLSAPAAAVESFYERLFQDGVFADSRGEHQQAAELLRLACFGMLDEPEPLTRCLVRLAVAQAAAEDESGYLESLGRMLDVERRFEAYELARLSPEARNRFERAVERWASYEAIADIAAFDRIAEAKLAEQIRQLDGAAARLELDRRIAVEPDNPVWRLLAVEFDVTEGAYEAAIREADALLDRHPSQTAARCLRGLAEHGLGRCSATTLDDLATCDQEHYRDGADRARIACLSDLGRADEAREQLASVPEARRDTDPYRQLARQLKRVERRPEVPAAEAPVTGTLASSGPLPTTEAASRDTTDSELASSTTPESTPPASSAETALVDSGPSEAERQRLITGWSQLRAADRSVFPATFSDIHRIADLHPEWPEAQHLAAEFAYRLSRWDDAVKYFERAEQIVSQRPDLQFYLAISLYKSGDSAAAKAMLERCLPRIQRSDFVVFWVERIQATG